MRQTLTLAAVLVMTAWPTLAPAQTTQMVDARNPQRIVEIARGFGSAELEKSRDGDPRITGRLNGTRYIITFMGCRENRNCTHIIFRAGWNNAKATFDEINKYNANKAFGVVYLDSDGDVNVDMAVNLSNGGVTRKNLDDTFDWWRLVLRDVIAAFVDKSRA